jgi:hypothetical protein
MSYAQISVLPMRSIGEKLLVARPGLSGLGTGAMDLVQAGVDPGLVNFLVSAGYSDEELGGMVDHPYPASVAAAVVRGMSGMGDAGQDAIAAGADPGIITTVQALGASSSQLESVASGQITAEQLLNQLTGNSAPAVNPQSSFIDQAASGIMSTGETAGDVLSTSGVLPFPAALGIPGGAPLIGVPSSLIPSTATAGNAGISSDSSFLSTLEAWLSQYGAWVAIGGIGLFVALKLAKKL